MPLCLRAGGRGAPFQRTVVANRRVNGARPRAVHSNRSGRAFERGLICLIEFARAGQAGQADPREARLAEVVVGAAALLIDEALNVGESNLAVGLGRPPFKLCHRLVPFVALLINCGHLAALRN